MEMNIESDKKEKVLFIQEEEYERILDISGEHLGLYLQQDIEKILLSYSASETIIFLNKVLKIGKRPSIKSFTKGIIFVLGNLDEAYTMSNNFSADIDADEFNKLSKKITVPQIKNALQFRFRNEQIARLGNIHIIYPALDKLSYTKIIQNELNKFAQTLIEKFKLDIEFDISINEIIYSEGVYPTQGVRPIFTSVHQILKSKISLFLAEIYLKSIRTDKLHFSVENKTLTCAYLNKEVLVYEKQVEIITTLGDARRNRRNDMQAITAVHESGHTVLSVMLLKTIPNVVYSITSDAGNQGFTQSSLAWEYISRKELIPRVAMFLGGYVAEEIIFGKESLTTGAASDIEKATKFLSIMYKKSGMGDLPICYSIPSRGDDNTYHNFVEVENVIKNTIEEAKQLAETTLKEEKVLLLELSDYLSDNRMLKKEEIRKIVDNRTKGAIDYIENGEHLFYRKHLKQQVQKNDFMKPPIPYYNNILSLNKDEK